MLIDHAGAVFPDYLPSYFRWIGRISFPVYASLIARGCVYTKNRLRYMIRLGVFALISEIPFDLAFGQYFVPYGDSLLYVNFLQHTNVFYTLFLGVASVNVYEKVRQLRFLPAAPMLHRILALLPAVLVCLLGDLLTTDYGAFGILLIFVLYLARSKWAHFFVLLCGVTVLYGGDLFYVVTNLGFGALLDPLLRPQILTVCMFLLFAVFAVFCVLLYNGRQGPRLKWAFYCFYPVHLAVLAAILILLYPLRFFG
jgi:hypothetical protein